MTQATAATSRRPARQRLAPDERQAQLLDAASEVFAHVPYDEAQVELIADKVGASASLIYHYFPNKRALFAAVVDRAIDELARMTEPPTDLPPMEQLRAGIVGYIDYVEAYEHAYRAMHRGREAGDARVQAAIERNTQRQVDRMLAAVDPELLAPYKDRVELAIRGSLTLIISACLTWLDDDKPIEKEVLIETLLGATSGAILGAIAPEVTKSQLAEIFQL